MRQVNKTLLVFALLTSFLILPGIAQDGEERDYKIQITVAGLTDSVAYLGFHFGNKRYLLDTTNIAADGNVIFAGKKSIKSGVYFLYTKTFLMEFIVDQSLNFSLKTDNESYYKNMVISGSEDNLQFRDFQMIMIEHQQKSRELTTSIDSTSTKADTLSVRTELADLNAENLIKRDSLKQVFGSSFAGQILTLMTKSPELKIDTDSLTIEQKKKQYAYYKDHFFDGIDFTSKGLIRTPNFYGKVKEYIDKVTFQNPDSIITSVDYLLAKCSDNQELYRFWLGHFFQEYQNAKIMGMDKIFVHLADDYYLNDKVEWADSTLIASLEEELIFHRENQIGLQAPQIYLVDTLDNRTNLYDIKSDYLVLFFYSPTCGHCKKKTPVLKELYEKMDGKFDVVAINVETDLPQWKKFIKDFDLEWLNLADPDYRSNFRVQYNVRSTPQIYVLNKEKTIIAKKLDVDQIEMFINDQIRINSIPQ